jgi:hypothetical protein
VVAAERFVAKNCPKGFETLFGNFGFLELTVSFEKVKIPLLHLKLTKLVGFKWLSQKGLRQKLFEEIWKTFSENFSRTVDLLRGNDKMTLSADLSRLNQFQQCWP